VHLGHIYRANFMQDITRKVNSIHPEMVLITGDLFDGMDGDLSSFVKPLNDIQAKEGVFFITGNHETYLGIDKVLPILQETRVRYLKDEVADIDGLKLIGLDYPDRGEKKDIVATLRALENDFSGQPNILLYHSPTNIKQFAASGVDLQLSGHTHVGQIFPFEYITQLIYQGYDYGLHQIGNYTLYSTNGVGTWSPAVRTGNTPEIVVITLE
jgi:hypothetical protein